VLSGEFWPELYNSAAVTCPLCQQRKARRSCPALNYQICAVCCGSKRLTEIACPASCPYLATAREHPPATVRRQQERDLALLIKAVRDFGERQSQLFFATAATIVRHTPDNPLESPVDADVLAAAEAMAATFETAGRGVIYEHRPSSRPAERLVAVLKPMFIEAGRGSGSSFERDAAVVLRRVAEVVGDAAGAEPGNRRVFLEWLARISQSWGPAASDTPAAPQPSPLIVP
jgi:hypothetical protein